MTTSLRKGWQGRELKHVLHQNKQSNKKQRGIFKTNPCFPRLFFLVGGGGGGSFWGFNHSEKIKPVLRRPVPLTIELDKNLFREGQFL